MDFSGSQPNADTEPDIDDPDDGVALPEEPPIIIPEVKDNEAETVRRLREIYYKYRDHPMRQEIEINWRRDYYAYRGIKSVPEQYKIREIFRQVETLIPQICKVVLDGEEKFAFTARQEGFDEDADGTTAIVHDQLQRFGSIEQLYMWVEHCVKFGTSYVMPSWRKFKQTRYKMTPMYAEGTTDEWKRETSEIPQDAPFLEFLPCFGVYSDPNIEEIRFSPMVFVPKGVSVDDLKTMAREGYLDPDAVEAAVNDGQNANSDIRRSEVPWTLTYGYADGGKLLADTSAYFEILQCWSFDGMHYVILGDHVLHAAPTQDPEIPIVDLRWCPQAREHYGVSFISGLLEYQRILDELATMFIKQHWFDLPRYQGDKANQDAYNMTVAKPGSMIPLKDYSKPFQLMPQSGASGTSNLNAGMMQILNAMKEETGVTDEMSGTASNTGTATGIVKLQAAAGDRIQHAIARMIPSFKRVYGWLYNLNARYLQDTYRLRIQGSDGMIEHKVFTPEVFQPDIDVNIEIGGGTGAEIANTVLNGYKVMGQDPLSNRLEMMKEFWKATGLPRWKRFLSSIKNQQADALGEGTNLMATGIIADPTPTDDHQTHVQIHQMQMQQMGPMAPPDVLARMQNHLAIHMMYLQQMQQANAQAQQAQMQQGNQAQGIGQQANARTEGMFQNGQRGAAQMGAA